MANTHRTNVLVTSCLKAPVDPRTKVPLAAYERDRGHMDNRLHEKELEYEDSGSDFCDDNCLQKGGSLVMMDYRGGNQMDLCEIFFSNEEYYAKLEELKKAHLRTMAELESMYHRKLQLKAVAPPDTLMPEVGHRPPWTSSSPAASRHLRKSQSAVELRIGSGLSDSSDEAEAASNDVEKGLLVSPKEHIKNMWKDFRLSPDDRHLSSLSLPGAQQSCRHARRGIQKDGEPWRHRVTVPKPFQMTVREDEKRKRGVKTRSEVEVENAELRRQLDELTECQMKFRASPVPAHVHLPLYEELQEKNEERRRSTREREQEYLRTVQKPFSFLERERLKKEQRQLLRPQSSTQEKVKPFRAKPVPRAIYAAASGEQMKEEQLYRSIKIQMRAQEMLHSSSMPPSMLARRLTERKKSKDSGGTATGGFSHRPQINTEVPDFDASYRRFKKHLEKRKEVKPTTACEPFELRTAQIPSHRERILADLEKERSSPRPARWPYVKQGSARTPNSSLCSSLSGSLELLPAKGTDATKKRHEAVRYLRRTLANPSVLTVDQLAPSPSAQQVLEQRKKAEEAEERWQERQRQREKNLQKVVQRRAQANDPHQALAQTHNSKLKEFRKQDRQRKKEYQQEIREIQERVKGRPLLLEQVAQRNAKQAAEKRFADVLHGCDMTEDLVSRKAGAVPAAACPSSEHTESDGGLEPVCYRKVYLDDEDKEVDSDEEGGRREEEEEHGGASVHHEERYDYSDDHENYSGDSEREDD